VLREDVARRLDTKVACCSYGTIPVFRRTCVLLADLIHDVALGMLAWRRRRRCANRVVMGFRPLPPRPAEPHNPCTAGSTFPAGSSVCPAQDRVKREAAEVAERRCAEWRSKDLRASYCASPAPTRMGAPIPLRGLPRMAGAPGGLLEVDAMDRLARHARPASDLGDGHAGVAGGGYRFAPLGGQRSFVGGDAFTACTELLKSLGVRTDIHGVSIVDTRESVNYSHTIPSSRPRGAQTPGAMAQQETP
jgi:hypothetical protein